MLATWLRSLDKTTPLHSSKRGIDNRLMGATLVLAMTNETYTFSFKSMALRYTTPAYASSDASQNPCSWISSFLIGLGKYGLGMRCSLSAESSCRHLPQVFSMGAGTGWSQLRFFSHNSCNNIFINIIAGEHQPITSNRRAMLDTRTRLLNSVSCSGKEIIGRKQSDCAFHSTPRTLVKSF